MPEGPGSPVRYGSLAIGAQGAWTWGEEDEVRDTFGVCGLFGASLCVVVDVASSAFSSLFVPAGEPIDMPAKAFPTHSSPATHP